MKTLIWFIVWATALARLAWAGDPQSPRAHGHVLLLDNQRTVEGDIELDGGQYRVRRQVGETWVPAGNVLCLCENLEEAYQFLEKRANLRDADEHIRLGRWCQLHGLRPQSLAEAKAALALSPQNDEAQRLLQILQRAASVPAPAPSPVPDAAKPVPSTMLPSFEVNAEVMGQFVSRVQPVLMNACATCHASSQAGSFRLVRAQHGGVVNRHATQQNLQAVLAQVNRDHWETSPLLTKAVTVHGQANQPPLKNRQAPPFRNLEEWVRGTLARNPQGQDTMLGAGAPLAEPKRLSDLVMAKAEALGDDIPAAPRPAIGTETGAASKAPPSEERPTAIPPAAPQQAAPLDPFDPVIFNRQMHPQGRKSAR
jgi:hypothetical protein